MKRIIPGLIFFSLSKYGQAGRDTISSMIVDSISKLVVFVGRIIEM